MPESNPYTTPESETELYEGTYQPKIFALNGRIGRLRYLAYSMIYNMTLYFILGILSAIMVPMIASSGNPNAYVGLLALFYIPALALYIIIGRRRLNDLDKSGWFLLFFLVPIANLILGLYMLFASGTAGNNRFGPRPSKNHPALWIGLVVPFFIVGLLAAIAIPAYQDYVERAKSAQNFSIDN